MGVRYCLLVNRDPHGGDKLDQFNTDHVTGTDRRWFHPETVYLRNIARNMVWSVLYSYSFPET
jgi:hypothetical protein